MEIPRRQGYCPRGEEEEEAAAAVFENASSRVLLQCPSTNTIAQDACMHSLTGSSEETLIQEKSSTEAIARACILPENSAAEAMGRVCNSLENHSAIQELGSSDKKLIKEQIVVSETPKYGELHPVDGSHTSSLSGEQISHSPKSFDPASSTKLMTQESSSSSEKTLGEFSGVLAEERPDNRRGKVWAVSEETAISSSTALACEIKAAVEGKKTEVDVMGTGTFEDDKRQVGRATASLDNGAGIEASVPEREMEPSVVTDSVSVGVGALQETVMESGLKPSEMAEFSQADVLERAMEFSEVAAVHDACISEGAGIETSHEIGVKREIGPAYFSADHDTHVSDGADTQRTVSESKVVDYCASQYSSDGVAIGPSLRNDFDREMNVFKMAEMCSGLGAGDLQKVELERRIEVFEVGEATATLSAGVGIGASPKTKHEREMECSEPAISHDTSLNDSTVTEASQNMELDREMKVSEVTEMHASGVGASHDTGLEEEIRASLESTLIDGAGFGASQQMEPHSIDVGGIHSSRDSAYEASHKIELLEEIEDFKMAKLHDRAGSNVIDGAGIGASQKTVLKMETDHVEVGESHANLDTNLSIGASQESECEREMELPEPEQNIQDVQADLKPLPEGVIPEQQQRRKRGRKPGKKVAVKEEKDLSIGAPNEPELEKESEPFEGSPSKQNLHSVENDQKRVHEGDVPEQQWRRRGRKPGTKVAQKEEEDVCFVCFDGGKLILCDKRSCPKAYHIECTGRESEFFRKRGQWFCGWHVCARCSKSATLHCYMCPNALCNTCTKEASFLCIRKSRGLCEGCYPIVHMIEHNETINADGVQVDFNDQDTYEGLFKDYWQDLKLKLFLTSADIDKACKAKEGGEVLGDGGGNDDAEEVMGEEDGGSTDSDDGPPTTRHSRLMKRKRLTRSSVTEDVSASEFEEDEEDDDEFESIPKRGRTRAPEFDGWASKELADLIQSMKEDPKKQLPLFGVKKLLWRYVDDNKLTNPRRRGQILCDERLQKLFGKKNVGRFEMMKLIGLHIATQNKNTVTKAREFQSADSDAVELDDGDENWLGKRKPRRKSDDNKRAKPDPYEYAAVNVKNINLIYLKRSVLDELRNDPDLESKVVGAFVRIRVPGLVNKSDTCYRLVQVVGIKQIYDAVDPEKVTDVILEIMNLHKREEVTADLVSNQDIAEEECRRLRQSVRCGFIKAMTVGELEERARALREAKVKDWFEIELLRLSHLRDRASEKGRKKELRECVEKLQLLSSPEERERHLKAPFDIDADPHMDPNYESDDEELPADDSQGDIDGAQRIREKASSMRFFGKDNSTGGAEKLYSHWDNSSFLEAHVKPQDTQLKTSGWGQKEPGGKDNAKQFVEMQAQGRNAAYASNDKSVFLGQGKVSWGDGAGGRDQNAGWNHEGSFDRREVQWASNAGGGTERSGGWRRDETLDMVRTDTGSRFQYNRGEVSAGMVSGHVFSPIHTPGSASSAPAIAGTMTVDSEKEKIWYYQDPTRTIQGPFTMEQLRKWEKTNLFPLDLRIWRATETQDASILLSDALSGRFSNSISLGPSQQPNVNSFPLGRTQGPHVNGFPLAPMHGLNVNSFSVGATQGPNVNSFSPGSTQGINANGFPLGPTQGPNVRSFSTSPAQGSNVHGFPSGPTQVPNVHGFPPGQTQGPNVHGFPLGSTQGPNVHGFPAGPTQGPYVNNFSPVPTQGPYVNSFSAGPTQGHNVNSVSHGPTQGPNVTGFPHSLTQGSSVMPKHTQAPHFNNSPLGRTQGSHANSFPMGSTLGSNVNNISQMGRGMVNAGRDFRNTSVHSRSASDWQETGRRLGQEQHFFGLGSNKVEGSVRGSGQTVEHLASNDGGRGIQTHSAWGSQGLGEPPHDIRDGSNRGHFSDGPKFREGNDARFTPKKDLLCKYFARGLCKKGQACDFRHE